MNWRITVAALLLFALISCQPVVRGEDFGYTAVDVPVLPDSESRGVSEDNVGGSLNVGLTDVLLHADFGAGEPWGDTYDSLSGWQGPSSPLTAAFDPADQEPSLWLTQGRLEKDPRSGPISENDASTPSPAGGTENPTGCLAGSWNCQRKVLTTAGALAVIGIFSVMACFRGRRASREGLENAYMSIQ